MLYNQNRIAIDGNSKENLRSSSEPPIICAPTEDAIIEEKELNNRSSNSQIQDLDHIFSNMNI